MFIYTHTEIVPGFIAISAMLSSQYIIISGLIRDLHITAEHQLRWHADMLNVQVAVSSLYSRCIIYRGGPSVHSTRSLPDLV